MKNIHILLLFFRTWMSSRIYLNLEITCVENFQLTYGTTYKEKIYQQHIHVIYVKYKVKSTLDISSLYKDHLHHCQVVIGNHPSASIVCRWQLNKFYLIWAKIFVPTIVCMWLHKLRSSKHAILWFTNYCRNEEMALTALLNASSTLTLY